MRFLASAVTDIGISKKTNQDSVCMKIAETEKYGQVAMAVLCDGMGGLDKGELASATVIRAFCDWYDKDFPNMLNSFSWDAVASEWTRIVKEQNYRISQYGKTINVSLGTTVTAMLFVGGRYLIVHVGDSRVYNLKKTVSQLTEDQTFIAREIKLGRMTPEQAAADPRKNMLLQCCGASKNVEPQVILGKAEKESVYMLCSDGFRHVISDAEIYDCFNPDRLKGIAAMETNSKYLINLVKSRNEKDNITVALIKCSQ